MQLREVKHLRDGILSQELFMLETYALQSDLINTLVFVDDRGLLLDLSLRDLISRRDVQARDFTLLKFLRLLDNRRVQLLLSKQSFRRSRRLSLSWLDDVSVFKGVWVGFYCQICLIFLL